MKKIVIFHLFLCGFAFFPCLIYGLNEKTIVIGGVSGWGLAEERAGLIEVPSIRPGTVLVLSSNSAGMESSVPDLAVSFDEGRPDLWRDRAGRYRMRVSNGLQAADRNRARRGAGAVLFQTGAGGPASVEPLLLEPAAGEAFFAPGRRQGDFSLEFWLCPLHMENGEQVLAWTASGTENRFQSIQCTAVKNRLQWTFSDFFISPGGKDRIDLSFPGGAPVVPGIWAHHLIRFEADTGLLEYMVNGRSEAIVYATSSGGEGGEVYTPLIGAGGLLSVGNRFSGLMDEFMIRSDFSGKPGLQKYRRGGRLETGAVDLGRGNNGVLKIEASGGRTRNEGGINRNIYGRGGFSFPDNAGIRFFIRTSDNPFRWNETDWLPVLPGTDLPEIHGRYVQLAADFYPSGDGETSPYLEELRIVYLPDEPPRPPPALSAVSRDGAVELSWKPSPDQDTEGYLVYYGVSGGEYFGEDAILGKSPIDAGKRTSLRIEGLANGVLYYFAVAAYDGGGASFHAGEFSRETAVRPGAEPLVRPGTELSVRPERMLNESR